MPKPIAIPLAAPSAADDAGGAIAELMIGLASIAGPQMETPA